MTSANDVDLDQEGLPGDGLGALLQAAHETTARWRGCFHRASVGRRPLTRSPDNGHEIVRQTAEEL